MKVRTSMAMEYSKSISIQMELGMCMSTKTVWYMLFSVECITWMQIPLTITSASSLAQMVSSTGIRVMALIAL